MSIDKQCRDIVANWLLKNNSLFKNLHDEFKSNKISKADYIETLYSRVDSFLFGCSEEELRNILTTQKYFTFNVSKQLDKLSTNNPAAYIAEPILICRTDSDGDNHYLLDAYYQKGDEVIKYLPLDPDKLKELMERLENLNLYCCGINWFKKADSPSIFIFGKESFCEELKQRLVITYGLE